MKGHENGHGQMGHTGSGKGVEDDLGGSLDPRKATRNTALWGIDLGSVPVNPATGRVADYDSGDNH